MGEVNMISESLTTPLAIRSLQRKLSRKAKAEPGGRWLMQGRAQNDRQQIVTLEGPP
jgi:hypothetical protein